MKRARILVYLLFVSFALLTGVTAADHAVRAVGAGGGAGTSECPAMKQECPAMKQECPAMKKRPALEGSCPRTGTAVDASNMV